MDSKRYQILSASRRRRAISRFLGLFVAAGLVVAALGYVLPHFIDWDSYRSEIERSLTDVLGVKVAVNGSIKGSLLMPRIEVKRVKVDYADQVSVVEKLEMRISPLSLLSFSPKISAVMVQGADLFIDRALALLTNRARLKSVLGVGSRRDIILKDVNLKLSSNFEVFSDIRVSDASVDLDGDQLDIVGHFKMGEGFYNLNVKGDLEASALEITSESIRLAINFQGEKGRLKGSGDSVIPFLSDLFGWQLIKAAGQSQFVLESDLVFGEGDYAIRNMKVSSENLKLLLDASWGKTGNDTRVVVSELDLDKLVDLGSGDGTSPYAQSVIRALGLLGSSVPADREANLMINAKNVVYNQGVVEDLLLKATMHSGEIKVDTMNASLPGNSTLSVLGAIRGDGLNSKFEGDLALIGPDAEKTLAWLSLEGIGELQHGGGLDFKTRVIAVPGFVMVSGLSLKIGGTSFSGELKLQDSLGEGLFSGIIIGENVNFDRYYDYFWGALGKRKNRSGFDFAVEVDLYNSILHGYRFSNLSFYVDSSKSVMLLDRIRFTSDRTSFEGRVKFDYANLRTAAEITLVGESFDSRLLNMADLFEVVPNDSYELGNKEIRWSQKAFDWLGIRELDGTFNLKFDRVFTKSFEELKNVVAETELKDGVLSIGKLDFGVGKKGMVTLVGNIGIEEETSLALSFAANGVNLQEVLQLIDVRIATGVFSCNGSVRSRGGTTAELVANLSGVSNFSFRNVMLEGLGSDGLIEGLLGVDTKADLATLTQVVLFEGSTKYHSVDGNANIKNGILGTSLQFLTDRSSGFLAANFSLTKFMVNGLARYFFAAAQRGNEVLFIDMNIQGSLWRPKVFFDNEKLYNLVLSKKG